jgi:hypothetical protein
MAPKRNAEEIAKLLEGFQASGLTRVEYCQQAGITPHTLDYYRRRADTGQRLVQVKVRASGGPVIGFVLTLANGRRIESGWEFSDGDLARLIRVAESA